MNGFALDSAASGVGVDVNYGVCLEPSELILNDVRVRDGEFVHKDLAREYILRARGHVYQIVRQFEHIPAWLVFSTGGSHANRLVELFEAAGIESAVFLPEMSNSPRCLVTDVANPPPRWKCGGLAICTATRRVDRYVRMFGGVPSGFTVLDFGGHLVRFRMGEVIAREEPVPMTRGPDGAIYTWDAGGDRIRIRARGS